MIIEVEQPTFMLNKNNPEIVSYKTEFGYNWQAITVEMFPHGFPELNENEILFKYKNRGFIYKQMINKKYIHGDIEYEYTVIGNNILVGIYYSGDGDPVSNIDKFISDKNIINKNHCEFVDINMDNPWVRFIVIGDNCKYIFTK